MNWLLLRGLSREQRHFREFPELLSAAGAGRSICLDLPGFGSEHRRPSPWTIEGIADDLRARLAPARGDARWSILGVSLGGMVTLDWCARYPHDFERCVVINASARPAGLFERFHPIALRAVVAALGSDLAARERAVLELTSSATAADLAAAAVEQAGWLRERRPRRASLLAQLWAAARFRLPAAVPTPMLVLTSRGDRLVSPRCSERIAARYAAPLRIHGAAGHDLTLDAPDWAATEIATWLAAS